MGDRAPLRHCIKCHYVVCRIFLLLCWMSWRHLIRLLLLIQVKSRKENFSAHAHYFHSEQILIHKVVTCLESWLTILNSFLMWKEKLLFPLAIDDLEEKALVSALLIFSPVREDLLPRIKWISYGKFYLPTFKISIIYNLHKWRKLIQVW